MDYRDTLNGYVLAYLAANYPQSAAVFQQEARASPQENVLEYWWRMFWDVHSAKHSESRNDKIESTRFKVDADKRRTSEQKYTPKTPSREGTSQQLSASESYQSSSYQQSTHPQSTHPQQAHPQQTHQYAHAQQPQLLQQGHAAHQQHTPTTALQPMASAPAAAQSSQTAVQPAGYQHLAGQSQPPATQPQTTQSSAQSSRRSVQTRSPHPKKRDLESILGLETKRSNELFDFEDLFLHEEDAPLRRTFTIAAHYGKISALDVSSDSKYLATAGTDYVVKLWSLEDHSELGNAAAHTNYIACVRFLRGASLFASASFDQTLKVFDCKHGLRQIKNIRTGANMITGIEFKDNATLVTIDMDGELRFWDLESAMCSFVYRVGVASKLVRAMPLDDNVLVLSQLNAVVLFDMGRKKLIRSQTTSQKNIVGIEWSGDGARVLLRTSDTLTICDNNMHQLARYTLGSDVGCAAFVGSTVVFGSYKRVYAWDDAVKSTEAHESLVSCVAAIGDKNFVTAGHDGMVHGWEKD